MRALVHLAGLWVASEIAGGKIPKQIALPLGWLVAQLRTPPLAIAILGCALQQVGRNRRQQKTGPRGRR